VRGERCNEITADTEHTSDMRISQPAHTHSDSERYKKNYHQTPK